MNKILKAIEEGKESVDFYLSDTPTAEFISDVQDIVKTYSDKQAIRVNNLTEKLCYKCGEKVIIPPHQDPSKVAIDRKTAEAWVKEAGWNLPSAKVYTSTNELFNELKLALQR